MSGLPTPQRDQISADYRELFEPRNRTDYEVYKMLTASVVPRPIAWVSTRSRDGVLNLAPYSFFTVTSANPPIVQFSSIGRKDSWRNIIDTNEFVVNIGSEGLIPAINHTSAPFAPSVDEFAEAGVTPEPSAVVAVPRIAEAPIAIECTRHMILDIGETCVIMGRVVNIAVKEGMLGENGRPDFAKVAAPTRLGGREWGLAPETVLYSRPILDD